MATVTDPSATVIVRNTGSHSTTASLRYRASGERSSVARSHGRSRWCLPASCGCIAEMSWREDTGAALGGAADRVRSIVNDVAQMLADSMETGGNLAHDALN